MLQANGGLRRPKTSIVTRAGIGATMEPVDTDADPVTDLPIL